MNKQPEITDATRKRILDAFWTLYKDAPVDKITAGNLAAAAGIHRSSFYRYFPDVYQVFDDVQEELLQELKSRAEEIQNTTDISLPEYTQKTAELLLCFSDKLYRVLNDKDAFFRERFIANVRPNIEKAIGLTGKEPFAEYVTYHGVETMLTNFNFWYENRDRYELTEVNAMGQKVLLQGLPGLLETT